MGYIYSDSNKTDSQSGKSLFDFADTLSIRVPTSCGRTGDCHECIVQVTDGGESLSKKEDLEGFLGPEFRLACQAKIISSGGEILNECEVIGFVKDSASSRVTSVQTCRIYRV